MTETYPIPNQLQLPNIPQSSYTIQDDGALATAQAANFIRQWNEVTNISNADRAQSLREKQFQQLVVQNDRDFDLRREKQDQDMRIGDLSFELKKFQYDTEKKNFNQLEETWAKKDEIIGALEAFSPNGGNDQQYPQARVRVFKMFANNPNAYKIVQGILGPYDEQYQVFKANKYSEDAVEVQGAFDDGLLDGVTVGDTRAVDYWRNAKLNQNDDPDGFAAAVRQLRRKINEIRTTEAEGKFAAQSVAEGNIVTREIKLPDGTTLKSTAPRVYGTSRTGTSTGGGASADGKFAKDWNQEAINLGPEIEKAQSAVNDATDPIEKAAADVELRKLVDLREIFRQGAREQVERVRGQPTQGAPSAQPAKPTSSPGLLGPVPGAPPMPSKMGVPTTSTGQPTPATTASATPARQPLYFVTADGSRSLTPDEGFLAQLRGENVIPVYEKQEESAEEKATREQFLTSAAEAIGTAPAIPPNIASF
jgi:hypothetical protein